MLSKKNVYILILFLKVLGQLPPRKIGPPPPNPNPNPNPNRGQFSLGAIVWTPFWNYKQSTDILPVTNKKSSVNNSDLFQGLYSRKVASK